MAGFGGFTDEEIFRLKMQGEGLNFAEAERIEPMKKASINNTGKRGKPREKLRTRQANSKSNTTTVKEGAHTSPTGMTMTNESSIKEQKPAEDTAVDVKTEVEKPHEVKVVMEPERYF